MSENTTSGSEFLERDEDVEGHRIAFADGGSEDTEGHRYLTQKVDAGDEDDVEGHVQPRRDIDVER